KRPALVAGLEHLHLTKINHMLAVRDLVMRRFDFEPHALEDVDHRPARLFAQLRRRQIEVTANVVRDGRRFTFRVRPKEKELSLHSRVHGEAERRRACEHPLQNTAWVTSERLAVRSVDVADDSTNPVLGIAPGEYLKRRQIR